MAGISDLLGAAGIGGNIGKAIVALELNTSKYLTELKGAQAQTTAGANAMGSGLTKASGLATTALLGAGAAAVAFGAFSVKAAIEANDAHLKLTNTFKNNANLADSSVEAFERQAGAIRDLTGVDDEAIIVSQALLGQFDVTGKQVQELTPLVVDLSEKMGIDLTAAAKSVGKAVIGNTAGLQRYGIVIDEAKGKGSEFDSVLQGLNDTVGGFAKARGAEEPWRILGAQFEEIAEKLGMALLPILKDVTDAVIAMLPFIEGLITGFQQLGHWVAVAVDWMGRFFKVIGEGVPVTNEMVDLIGKTAKPFLDTADAAKQAGEAVDHTGGKIERFADMSWKELHDWTTKSKEALREATFSLSGLGEQSTVTGQDFRDAQHQMLQDARELGRSMRELSHDDWINDDYVQFLVDQGPSAIVAFSELNDKQQHRLSEQWTRSSQDFDRTIRNSFNDFGHILDDLDNKTTKHTVEVVYKYTGFDPSKPGMTPAGNAPPGRKA